MLQLINVFNCCHFCDWCYWSSKKLCIDCWLIDGWPNPNPVSTIALETCLDRPHISSAPFFSWTPLIRLPTENLLCLLCAFPHSFVSLSFSCPVCLPISNGLSSFSSAIIFFTLCHQIVHGPVLKSCSCFYSSPIFSQRWCRLCCAPGFSSSCPPCWPWAHWLQAQSSHVLLPVFTSRYG